MRKNPKKGLIKIKSKNIPKISDRITYLDEFQKDSKDEIAKADRWIIERRKFFIKLAWLVGMVGVLLILSYIFIRPVY